MKGKGFLIAVGLWLALSWSGNRLFAAETKKSSLFDQQPIEITANRLEASDDKRMVLFSGNAVATQGERVIKAEHIALYYKGGGGGTGKDGLMNRGKMGDLERIEAKGQVSFVQGDRLVTGEEAVYYQDSQKIVMTGSAVMRQGNNLVRGDTIEVFLTENRGVVEAAENRRVKATIYPGEKGATP